VKFSIVIPAFNEELLLAGTLQRVKLAAAALSGAWELIVCDNNSTDRTAEIARAAGAKVVFEPHNQISRARNKGASAAAGEWLVFIDADSAPSAGLLSDMEAAATSGAVLAGGSTIAPDSTSFGYRTSIRGWNLVSRLTHWAAGSFIYCQRSAFQEIGGFSEELYASEELDLFTRLKKLARQKGKRIEILHRHPLHTSDRKVHLYGWRSLARAASRFVLQPRASLRNRDACSPWYDGKR
jgi:glycosyltransferase involved in cell wall biosynthesis